MSDSAEQETEEGTPKFLTFHTDEFFEAIALEKPVDEIVEELAILDAVVIRKQDVFAASVLFQYANSVRTMAEILEGIDENDVFTDEVANLNRLADHFADEGMDSSNMERKFPD